MELFCQTRSGRTIPDDSPGSGNPVGQGRVGSPTAASGPYQGRKCELGITNQANRLIVAPDLTSIDVDMNIAGSMRIESPAVGAVLVSSCSD